MDEDERGRGSRRRGPEPDPMGDLDLSIPAKYQAPFLFQHAPVVGSSGIDGQTIGLPLGIKRGHLEMMRPVSDTAAIQATADAPANMRYGLNFLLNPENFVMNYGFNRDGVFDPANDPGQDPSRGFVPSEQTYHVRLLFDRTYEIWTNSDMRSSHEELGGQFVRDIGVQEDVWQFEKLIGLHNSSFHTGVPNPSVPILYMPATSAFEAPLSGNAGERVVDAWKPMLGWINGADVTYTHFSYRMIPMRAVVGMSFIRYVQPPDVGLTGSVSASDALVGALGGGVGTALTPDIFIGGGPVVSAPPGSSTDGPLPGG